MPSFSAGLTSVFLGLASALCWSASDFSGGLASKRGSALGVVVLSQSVGLLALIVVQVALREPLPAAVDLLRGAAAGLGGGIGLVAFYRALADGQMGLIAPVSALIGALVPLPVAVVLDGWPGPVTLVGLLIALAAVWLVSSGDGDVRLSLRDLRLPLVAGLGFGAFFIFMGGASATALLWPLIAARTASVTLLGLVALLRGELRRPPTSSWPLIALAGVLDTGANALYVLAARTGRLDVAAVLGSLYPGGTVLLAWLILRERLSRWQMIGAAAIVVATILIAW